MERTFEDREILIRAQQLTVSVPVVRKGDRSVRKNPFSLVTELYAPSFRRELRTLISDFALTVREGDRVGILGHNGAGKTTLLRVFAGVITPTSGTIEVAGRVRALLNLTLGLRDEATGLQNIYLNGLSLGFTIAELRERIDSIVAFSELGDAIHDPVRTYSAGMRLRLAFSTVTSMPADVLLMDEWISAGDKDFLTKAKVRLLGTISASRALVLASHSAATLLEICNRGIVLRGGRMIFEGDIEAAVAFHQGEGTTASAASA